MLAHRLSMAGILVVFVAVAATAEATHQLQSTSVGSHETSRQQQQLDACNPKRGCKLDSSKNTSVTELVHTPNTKEDFFAWNLNDDLPLMQALFPDLTRLQAAWETHPLLSKVSFETKSITAPLFSIPTLFHNRSSVAALSKINHGKRPNNRDPLFSMFSLDDALKVVSHPHLKHGNEYRIMKQVEKDGEQLSGMLPSDHYDIDDIVKYVQSGGFSIIINNMEQRWGSIGRMARQMAEELSVLEVYAHLYVTPEVSLQGNSIKKNVVEHKAFGVHWDLMDGESAHIYLLQFILFLDKT